MQIPFRRNTIISVKFTLKLQRSQIPQRAIPYIQIGKINNKSYDHQQMFLKNSQQEFIIFDYTTRLNYGDSYIYRYQLKINDNFEDEKYFRNFNMNLLQDNLIDEWNKVWCTYEFKLNKQQISQELMKLIIPKNPIMQQADENFEYLILKHQALVENDNESSIVKQFNLKNVEKDNDLVVIQQKKLFILNFIKIEVSFSQFGELIENFIGSIRDKIQLLEAEYVEQLNEKNELSQNLEQYIINLQLERDNIQAKTNQIFDEMKIEYQKQEKEIKIQLQDKMRIQIPLFLNQIQYNNSECSNQIYGIFQSYQNKINELWNCQVKQNFQDGEEETLIKKQQEFLEIQNQFQDFLQNLEEIEEKLQVCDAKLNNMQEELNQKDNLLFEQNEKIMELNDHIQKKEQLQIQLEDELMNMQQEQSDKHCIIQHIEEQNTLLKEKDKVLKELEQKINSNLNSIDIQQISQNIETQIMKTKNVEEIYKILVAQNFQLNQQDLDKNMSIKEQSIIKKQLKQNDNLRQQLEKQLQNQMEIIDNLQNECQQLKEDLKNQSQINHDLQYKINNLNQQLQQKEQQYLQNSTKVLQLQQSLEELSQTVNTILMRRNEFYQTNIN